MSTLLKKAKEDYEKEREKMKLHNSTTGEFPLNKIAAEAYKVPREALKQKENEAEKLPVPVIIQENNPIDFEDVTTPLLSMEQCHSHSEGSRSFPCGHWRLCGYYE